MDFYRRFPGDYARDTRHLSLEEHGAYTLLLDHCYATESPIYSMTSAIQICGARSKRHRNAVKFVLENFFIKKKSGWFQSRVLEELKYAESKSNKAKQSANTRWERNANAMRTHSEGNAIPDNQTTRQPETHPPNTTSTQDQKTFSLSIKGERVWPEDFKLLPGAMRDYALAEGIPNPEREFEEWKDDCLAHNRKYVNWMAAWRNRIRRFHEFHKGVNINGSGSEKQKPGKLDRFEQAVTNLTGRGTRLAEDLRSNALDARGARDNGGGDSVLHGLPGKVAQPPSPSPSVSKVSGQVEVSTTTKRNP